MQSNFIANEVRPSLSGRTLDIIDPSDGQVFDRLQRSNAEDMDSAVRAARHSFETLWRPMAAAKGHHTHPL